jgi:hypothetical protein
MKGLKEKVIIIYAYKYSSIKMTKSNLNIDKKHKYINKHVKKIAIDPHSISLKALSSAGEINNPYFFLPLSTTWHMPGKKLRKGDFHSSGAWSENRKQVKSAAGFWEFGLKSFSNVFSVNDHASFVALFVPQHYFTVLYLTILKCWPIFASVCLL